MHVEPLTRQQNFAGPAFRTTMIDGELIREITRPTFLTISFPTRLHIYLASHVARIIDTRETQDRSRIPPRKVTIKFIAAPRYVRLSIVSRKGQTATFLIDRKFQGRKIGRNSYRGKVTTRDYAKIPVSDFALRRIARANCVMLAWLSYRMTKFFTCAANTNRSGYLYSCVTPPVTRLCGNNCVAQRRRRERAMIERAYH